MTRAAPRSGGLLGRRWIGATVAAVLAVGTTGAAVALPGLVTAAPTTTSALVTAALATPASNPGGDGAPEPPTEPPTPTEPAPTSAPPTAPPPTAPPAPTTTAPDPLPTVTAVPDSPDPSPTRTATPRPISPPTGGTPASGGTPSAPSRLGVRVTTGDVQLPARYWTTASTTTSLQITVTNTGAVRSQLGLTYVLPVGITDAGTPGCSSTGDRTYRCGSWTAEPGARFSTLIQVRVSGDAWRQMPLGGTVSVTATAPGEAGQVRDDEGFAILFPPGPPVPGIGLDADEVAFDITGGSSVLVVRLDNTGTVDAGGLIEVIMPDGVGVFTLPPDCVPGSAGRIRCAMGTVPAGQRAVLWMPLVATPQAQRMAPLAGGVIGRLDPRQGPSRQVQMSFRITAAAALSTPVVGAPQPTGSQGVIGGSGRTAMAGGGANPVRRTAIMLISVSGLLVVAALALATVSLRRWLTGRPDGTSGDTNSALQ